MIRSLFIIITSFANRLVPLQPAGLLGRFASSDFVLYTRIFGRFTPSGFELRACILLASLLLVSRYVLQNFSKKKVFQSTMNALKRLKMHTKLAL